MFLSFGMRNVQKSKSAEHSSESTDLENDDDDEDDGGGDSLGASDAGDDGGDLEEQENEGTDLNYFLK